MAIDLAQQKIQECNDCESGLLVVENGVWKCEKKMQEDLPILSGIFKKAARIVDTSFQNKVGFHTCPN